MTTKSGIIAVSAAGAIFMGTNLGSNFMKSTAHSNLSKNDAHNNLDWMEEDDLMEGTSGDNKGLTDENGKPIKPEDMKMEDANNDGTVSEQERKAWMSKLPDSKRGADGVHITTYGQPNDSTPDSNTRAARGFANNTLSEGSVALSPDIYQKYKPPIGSAVYVDGSLVGYYEDRTPSQYNGVGYGNTIDVYDPNNVYGSQHKNAGTNAQITFGPPRKQTSNP